MGRLEYAQAVADLTRAHDLAPTEPQYLYQRGLAYEQEGETERALADLGEAHMLDPKDVDILITRAEVRVKEHARSLALADLDAASRELPLQADSRFRLGTLYTQADGFGQASREFDTWIKVHPDDGKLAAAFYGRCRAGSLGGSDLPAALRACEAALRRNPNSGRFHEGVGLAHLRMGDLNAALADYNTALGIDHKLAWALYGRGVIELKQGKADQAKTDMAAAAAVDEELAEQWRRVGLAP
jgi:tetratricopeptide (TPR) repeat protein